MDRRPIPSWRPSWLVPTTPIAGASSPDSATCSVSSTRASKGVVDGNMTVDQVIADTTAAGEGVLGG